MQTTTARAITRVIPGSVATIPVNSKKSYRITPEVDKTNILLGMIAVPGNFPVNRTFYHQVFTRNNSAFDWPATINGTEFGFVHFYALLPWNKRPVINPPHYQTTYDVGLNDGEVGDLSRNQVATITVDHKNTADGGRLFNDTTNTSTVLPAPIIEFAANHHISVHPMVGPNKEPLRWAHLSIMTEHSKLDFESKARIHVISGHDSQDIIGFLDSDHVGPFSVPLGPLGTSNNNVNLIALITPTVNPDNPNDFTFKVGDPEKNGKVTIQQF